MPRVQESATSLLQNSTNPLHLRAPHPISHRLRKILGCANLRGDLPPSFARSLQRLLVCGTARLVELLLLLIKVVQGAAVLGAPVIALAHAWRYGIPKVMPQDATMEPMEPMDIGRFRWVREWGTLPPEILLK